MLENVNDGMRDVSAVIVLYADAKGKIAVRCLRRLYDLREAGELPPAVGKVMDETMPIA
jgi:hypothetical protein